MTRKEAIDSQLKNAQRILSHNSDLPWNVERAISCISGSADILYFLGQQEITEDVEQVQWAINGISYALDIACKFLQEKVTAAQDDEKEFHTLKLASEAEPKADSENGG